MVAGDGTGDHLLDAHAGDVPPAWDPARLHTVAYYSGGAIVLRGADGPLVWRAPITVLPSSLQWSSDGRYLAVVSPKQIVVLDRRGRVHRTISMLGAELRQATFEPGTHDVAVVVRSAGRSEVRVVDVDRPGRARLLFAGPGTFGDVEWSPSGALAARQLAGCEPVGVHQREAGARGRRTSASSSRARTVSGRCSS